MSSFFKQLFPFMKVKKKKEFSYIIKGVDPNTVWDLVGELGDGSFGKVYKAQHKTENILAAAKIIIVNDENDLEDFMVEIDILSEVKHKNVVGLYETYYHNGKLWMMLEFCSGGALDDLMLEIERGLNETEIKAVCRQLFEGLNVLHNNKIIHRDLKAGNLLLSNDGQIKLADFGVSAKNKKTLQRRTTFIGTPYWMAPEVVITETCKDNPYDYKSDIWSAGVTIVELANMVPPNHAMHPMRVLFKIPKADPPTLDGNRWSANLKDFLASCVVKSPEMRSTAAEMLKHPFLAESGDCKVLKDLFNEAKAEVIEEIEDLPEDTEVNDKDEDNRLKGSDSDEFLEDSDQPEKEVENEKEVKIEEQNDNVSPVGEKDSIEQKPELENNEVREESKENKETIEDVIDVTKEDENQEDVSKPEAEEKPAPEEEKPEEEKETAVPEEEDKKEEEESIPKVDEEKKEEVTEEISDEKEQEETKEEDQEEKITDKPEEPTPDSPEVVLPPDKYSTRFDNILDEMEDVESKDKKTTDNEKPSEEETTTEKTEEKETEDKDESEQEKNEEKDEGKEKKEEKERENEADNEDKKEIDNLQDQKDENLKEPTQQDGPGGPPSKMKEFEIYLDDVDVTENIKKAQEEKKEELTTDGKGLSNGALLAAELMKEAPVVKKEPEQTGEKHFKTLKRTRKFATQDGKIITETTSRVVDVSGEDFKNALMKEQQQRKMNLRDLKVLQRQEQKQGMELMSKIRRQWEAQEQRFEQEMQDLDKKVEAELDNLSRNQKKEIEKLELTQNADLRASSRKVKQDQEKELKKFKENLKEEMKKSKKYVDKMPRLQRKETWKKKKDELDVSHRQAEHEFLAMQQTEFEKFYKQMIDLHKQKMFEMEMQFLESKHERRRAHESEKWEMEFRHLNERHTLAKTQLKETFFLQRSQMLNRHQKEVEQHQHLTKLQEDEMKRRHEIERKRLPKIQRNEIKTKSQLHRKTLRDKKVSYEIEREQLKEFEDVERKRARSEYEKMLLRQDLEAEELRTSSDSALKELQQLQNEKRHMLMESETLKLKERDDKHNTQMMSWKAELGPRKKTLEEEFAREKREQQLFYARGGDAVPDTPPNDLRVPSDSSSRDSYDGSGGSQTGSQRTPDDTSSGRSSTGSMEI